MDDFRLIISEILKLFAIEISFFGYKFSIFVIFVGLTILSIIIGFVVKIFGGN